jgi:hypothetical protein
MLVAQGSGRGVSQTLSKAKEVRLNISTEIWVAQDSDDYLDVDCDVRYVGVDKMWRRRIWLDKGTLNIVIPPEIYLDDVNGLEELQKLSDVPADIRDALASCVDKAVASHLLPAEVALAGKLETSEPMDLVAYVDRQQKWSTRTFGPGLRTGGITKHIEQELVEIRDEPDDLFEWCDVVILALDGAWRSGHSPAEIAEALERKQAINFARSWPKPASQDEPSMHVKSEQEKEMSNTLSTSEVVAQIADVLPECDCDFIEYVANAVLGRKVRYTGDDMFAYIDGGEGDVL